MTTLISMIRRIGLAVVVVVAAGSCSKDAECPASSPASGAECDLEAEKQCRYYAPCAASASMKEDYTDCSCKTGGWFCMHPPEYCGGPVPDMFIPPDLGPDGGSDATDMSSSDTHASDTHATDAADATVQDVD